MKKIAVKSITHSTDYELYRNIVEVYVRLTDDMEWALVRLRILIIFLDYVKHWHLLIWLDH